MADDPSAVVLRFREFLEVKADGFGVRGHHQQRVEWVAAIRQLLDQIKAWLQRADPEHLLDIDSHQTSGPHETGSEEIVGEDPCSDSIPRGSQSGF